MTPTLFQGLTGLHLTDGRAIIAGKVGLAGLYADIATHYHCAHSIDGLEVVQEDKAVVPKAVQAVAGEFDELASRVRALCVQAGSDWSPMTAAKAGLVVTCPVPLSTGWAMTGQGLLATGATLGFTADSWSFINYVFRGVLASKYARVLGWWSLGLAALGFSLVWFLQDTPLETWLKHTPFGRSRHSINDDHYRHWKDWPALAREELASLQQTPRLSWDDYNSGIPQTNHDFWSQRLTLRILRPAWTEGLSQQECSLWWRPADRAGEAWQPLGWTNQSAPLGPLAIDWRHVMLEPLGEGSDLRLTLTWQALHALLKGSPSIELKAELNYYPQGKNRPFSRALNQPLVLPAPARSEPPFAINELVPVTAQVRVHSDTPVERVPLPDPNKRPVHLITGQQTG